MRIDPKANFSSSLWPAIPAPRDALLLAILDQLQESQWLPKKELMKRVEDQRDALIDHARSLVPAYQGLADIPVTTVPDLQQRPSDYIPTPAFTGHGSVRKFNWQGEAGEPLAMLLTELAAIYGEAAAIRAFDLAGFDADKCLGRIIPILKNPPEDWGLPFKTGPGHYCPATHSLEDQLDWIIASEIEYLALDSGNFPLLALAEKNKRNFANLQAVLISVLQIPTPDMRQSAESLFNVPIHWSITLPGFGPLAAECAAAGNYHLMLDTLDAEIVGDDGQACKTGQGGRLLVTNLHNFAMPVLRFDTGITAKMMRKCKCGRGLPVIAFPC